jgi:BirA family transcriptional regulator, biotin operon repressor / biotin---[acetyl-CoA-carboxylase] ligase
MTYPENLQVITLEQCDSTNNYLKKQQDLLLRRLPVLVTSNLQTAGRGRDQRNWISQRGKGLYSSFGFKLDNRQNLNLLPLIAGISVIETLKQVSPGDLTLKWPNDILYHGQKIAGILIENIIAEAGIFCITGIGINLNHCAADFPGILRDKAVSLKMITGCAADYRVEEINPLLAVVFFHWLERLKNNAREEILQTARQYTHFLENKPISFHHPSAHEPVTGIFRGINHDGGLILEDNDGLRHTYYSGEIV